MTGTPADPTTPPPDDESGPEASALYNASLAKGLQVLAAFGHDRRTMNLPEIAAAVGITKSAAQRSAFTLEAMGYLQKDPTFKRYSLTPKVLQLGFAYIATDRLVELANPYLQKLAANCGETVNLSVPYQDRMIFTARFPSQQHISVHMPLGSALPMFCTASGRAVLSTWAEEDVWALLTSAPLRTYTPMTITDPEAVMKIIAEARHNGYAVASEEYYRGDLNLAAPIMGGDNRAVAAVNISAPRGRWTIEALADSLSAMIMETVRGISAFNRQLD